MLFFRRRRRETDKDARETTCSSFNSCPERACSNTRLEKHVFRRGTNRSNAVRSIYLSITYYTSIYCIYYDRSSEVKTRKKSLFSPFNARVKTPKINAKNKPNVVFGYLFSYLDINEISERKNYLDVV